MNLVPRFPPLLTSYATGPANPFTVACDRARRGVDAGLLAWSIGSERLRAALVLAPETPLGQAMAGYVACAVGFQNALGATAPAETAVHLDWNGGLRLNGGHFGRIHAYASTLDPKSIPDWLVVGLDVTLELGPDFEPGQTPDWTSLYHEGCGEVDPVDLLEAWARHSLVWLHDIETARARANLHREYEGLLWKMHDETVVRLPGEVIAGKFLGVDEDFGCLVKPETGETRLLPLFRILEEAP